MPDSRPLSTRAVVPNIDEWRNEYLTGKATRRELHVELDRLKAAGASPYLRALLFEELCRRARLEKRRATRTITESRLVV